MHNNNQNVVDHMNVNVNVVDHMEELAELSEGGELAELSEEELVGVVGGGFLSGINLTQVINLNLVDDDEVEEGLNLEDLLRTNSE